MDQNESIVQELINALDDKKAENIRLYQLHDGTFSDHVLLASGTNTIHCGSLIDTLKQTIGVLNQKYNMTNSPFNVSGLSNSGWVVIELADTIIHIMTSELRQFYMLDSFFEKRGVVHYP